MLVRRVFYEIRLWRLVRGGFVDPSLISKSIPSAIFLQLTLGRFWKRAL